jgi:hypothetical protein
MKRHVLAAIIIGITGSWQVASQSEIMVRDESVPIDYKCTYPSRIQIPPKYNEQYKSDKPEFLDFVRVNGAAGGPAPKFVINVQNVSKKDQVVLCAIFLWTGDVKAGFPNIRKTNLKNLRQTHIRPRVFQNNTFEDFDLQAPDPNKPPPPKTPISIAPAIGVTGIPPSMASGDVVNAPEDLSIVVPNPTGPVMPLPKPDPSTPGPDPAPPKPTTISPYYIQIYSGSGNRMMLTPAKLSPIIFVFNQALPQPLLVNATLAFGVIKAGVKKQLRGPYFLTQTNSFTVQR